MGEANGSSPAFDFLSLSGLEELESLAKDTQLDCGSDSDDSFSWYQAEDADNFKKLTRGADPFPLGSIGPAAAQPLGAVNSAQTLSSVTTRCPLRSLTDKGIGDSDALKEVDDRPELPTSSTMQHPKPPYSFSCLIALALKNSRTGRLQVSEIYNFMRENFPYFRNARSGWKNSVRHNLSLNKMFQKIEPVQKENRGRSCCLWTLNKCKLAKIEMELRRMREKDTEGIRDSLANPADLELIEQGLKGMPGRGRPCSLQHPMAGGGADSSLFPVAQPQSVYGAPPCAPVRLCNGCSIIPHYHDSQVLEEQYSDGETYDCSFSSSQGNAVSSTTPTRYRSVLVNRAYGNGAMMNLEVVSRQAVVSGMEPPFVDELGQVRARDEPFEWRGPILPPPVASSPIRCSGCAVPFPTAVYHRHQSSPMRWPSSSQGSGGPYEESYFAPYGGGGGGGGPQC